MEAIENRLTLGKSIRILLLTTLASLAIHIVTITCAIPGGEREPGMVELRLFWLASSFAIPFIAGIGVGHVMSGRISQRVFAGLACGLLISVLMFANWAFTRRDWWPDDEPVVFAGLAAFWIAPAVLGSLGSVVTRRLPDVP